MRRIRVPAARGEIVDRNGVILANNRPSYDVAIYLDQLGRVSKRTNIVRVAQANLGAMSAALGMPVTITDSDVLTHYEQRAAASPSACGTIFAPNRSPPSPNAPAIFPART